MFSTHQPYPVRLASFSGASQNGRSASVSASSMASTVSKMQFESCARSSSNQRSAGFNSGLYAGSCIASMPAGQCTSVLRCAPAPSRTRTISSSGYRSRSLSRKTLVEGDFEAVAVEVRHVQAEALSGGRFVGRRQPYVVSGVKRSPRVICSEGERLSLDRIWVQRSRGSARCVERMPGGVRGTWGRESTPLPTRLQQRRPGAIRFQQRLRRR